MAVYFGFLFLIMIYCTYLTLVKKQGLGKNWQQKYTRESIEKYSVYGAIGCIMGAIGSLLMLLLSFGIINLGFSMEGHSIQKTVLIIILIAVIVVPIFFGTTKLVRKDQASMSSITNVKYEEDEDEDF